LPVTTAGVLAWLVSTLPNLGAQRAQALVDLFGPKLWDVIEHASAELCQVPGITPARAQAIYDAYQQHRDTRDSMVALRGWGLTDGQVRHCLEHWHTLARTVDEVRANPYQLIRHVYGFGFDRADQVAGKIGVSAAAPERIAAGVEHVLDLALSAGHCYVHVRPLQLEVARVLKCPAPAAAQGIRDAVAGGQVVQVGWCFYPAHIARAESRCAAALRAYARVAP
jgi:exodeoxyribonuclease V alpha subunit